MSLHRFSELAHPGKDAPEYSQRQHRCHREFVTTGRRPKEFPTMRSDLLVALDAKRGNSRAHLEWLVCLFKRTSCRAAHFQTRFARDHRWSWGSQAFPTSTFRCNQPTARRCRAQKMEPVIAALSDPQWQSGSGSPSSAGLYPSLP